MDSNGRTLGAISHSATLLVRNFIEPGYIRADTRGLEISEQREKGVVDSSIWSATSYARNQCHGAEGYECVSLRQMPIRIKNEVDWLAYVKARRDGICKINESLCQPCIEDMRGREQPRTERRPDNVATRSAEAREALDESGYDVAQTSAVDPVVEGEDVATKPKLYCGGLKLDRYHRCLGDGTPLSSTELKQGCCNTDRRFHANKKRRNEWVKALIGTRITFEDQEIVKFMGLGSDGGLKDALKPSCRSPLTAEQLVVERQKRSRAESSQMLHQSESSGTLDVSDVTATVAATTIAVDERPHVTANVVDETPNARPMYRDLLAVDRVPICPACGIIVVDLNADAYSIANQTYLKSRRSRVLWHDGCLKCVVSAMTFATTKIGTKKMQQAFLGNAEEFKNSRTIRKDAIERIVSIVLKHLDELREEAGKVSFLSSTASIPDIANDLRIPIDTPCRVGVVFNRQSKTRCLNDFAYEHFAINDLPFLAEKRNRRGEMMVPGSGSLYVLSEYFGNARPSRSPLLNVRSDIEETNEKDQKAKVKFSLPTFTALAKTVNSVTTVNKDAVVSILVHEPIALCGVATFLALGIDAFEHPDRVYIVAKNAILPDDDLVRRRVDAAIQAKLALILAGREDGGGEDGGDYGCDGAGDGGDGEGGDDDEDGSASGDDAENGSEGNQLCAPPNPVCVSVSALARFLRNGGSAGDDRNNESLLFFIESIAYRQLYAKLRSHANRRNIQITRDKAWGGVLSSQPENELGDETTPHQLIPTIEDFEEIDSGIARSTDVYLTINGEEPKKFIRDERTKTAVFDEGTLASANSWWYVKLRDSPELDVSMTDTTLDESAEHEEDTSVDAGVDSHSDALLDASSTEDEDEREESIENYETTPFVIDLADAQRRRDDTAHKQIPTSTSRRQALSPPQRQPPKRVRGK